MMQDSKAVHTKTVRIPNERKGAYKKRIAHIIYSVIGGSALLLAGIPPIPANAVPPCFDPDFNPAPPGPGKTLVVYNGCRVAKRVKVIIANGPSIGCFTYRSGGFYKLSYLYSDNARIDSVVSCQ